MQCRHRLTATELSPLLRVGKSISIERFDGIRGGGFTGELGMQAEVSPEGPYELDPYADLRPALRPEHATLAPAEIILTLGRQPAVLALHRMLAAPESQQAVLAVMLGHAGRRSIRVSGSTVPIPVLLQGVRASADEVAEQLGTEPAGRERFSEENADRVPLAGETIFTEPGKKCRCHTARWTARLGWEFRSLLRGRRRNVSTASTSSVDFPNTGVTIDQLGTEQRTILGRIAAEIASGTGADDPSWRCWWWVTPTPRCGNRWPSVPHSNNPSVSNGRRTPCNLIMREARRLAGSAGAPFIGGLQTRSIGVGSTQRLVISPHTEIERRLNRRVEVMLAHCALPPNLAPWTWRDAATRGRSY